MNTSLSLQTGISSALRTTPLTFRSILLLLFCGYLLLGPVPYSSDIVAASLAYGLLTLWCVIALAGSLQALYVKRQLALEMYPPEETLIAGRSARCVLTFSQVRLLPGMLLECRPVCEHAGITIPTVRLFQGTPVAHRVAIDILAPHRGNWDIHGIRCTVGDGTGFIRVQWTIALESSLIVTPPPQPDALLPLISSTQRAGDLVTDAVHRLGDPFDIKPYHPSDGVKKIVWKAFAKSGQLLSRHPEPSMTPEGFVALFVLARPEDDEVCGKALAYVHTLRELTLDLLVGCEGQRGRPHGTSVETSQELLIDATWDAQRATSTSLRDDLQALFDGCTRTGVAVNLEKIVVFCSGTRIASDEGATLMQELIRWMEQQQITPVFFITQPRINQASKEAAWTSRAKGILFESAPSGHHDISAQEYQRFLATCLSRQWEVFV